MEGFTEKTIEDIIMTNLEKVVDRGFPTFYSNVKRQYRLPSGLIMDIFTWEVVDDVLYFKIIELKRRKIVFTDLWQICAYYVEVTGRTNFSFSEVRGEVILVGSCIDQEIRNVMSLGLSVDIYKYSYDFNGINFYKWEKVNSWESFSVENNPDNESFCLGLESPELKGAY